MTSNQSGRRLYQSLGTPQRCICLIAYDSTTNLNICIWIYSHQTPVYDLYQIPTIVCAVILLATRLSEPHVCWWELFDAKWEDVWTICRYIMRLYR